MSDEKMKGIIERIKARRQDLDMSFQELADKTGMSKSTLQRYETGGIKNIPLDKLDVLAKGLRTTASELLGVTEEESYYIDPEVAELAEEMRNRPELKVMLSAARDITKEDIEAVNLLIKKLGGKNNDTF